MRNKVRRPNRLAVFTAIAVIGVAVLLVCLYVPGVNETFSPYMYSEAGGKRQYDYKYLGLIPYSRIEAVPGLRTEEKVDDHFKSVGITLPSGLSTLSKGAVAARMYYKSGVRSHLQFDNVKHVPEMYTFFKSQAGKLGTDRIGADGSWELWWDTSDGKYTVRIEFYDTYGGTGHASTPQTLLIQVSPYQPTRTIVHRF